ncbi:hypothetical protein ACO0QE_002382 [Hanseniaspora vineae]
MNTSDMYIQDTYIEQEKKRESTKNQKKLLKTATKVASVIMTILVLLVFINLTHPISDFYGLSNSSSPAQSTLLDTTLSASKEVAPKEATSSLAFSQTKILSSDKAVETNERLIQLESTKAAGGPVVKDSIGKGAKSSQKDTVDTKNSLYPSISGDTKSTKSTKTSKKLSDQGDITLSSSAMSSIAAELHEILNTSPVVIFGKKNEPDSEYLYNLLTKEYEVTPEPIFVDLDKHTSGPQIQKYIQTKKIVRHKEVDASNTMDIPYLFINGVSVINTGVTTDIKKNHASNKLLDKLKAVASDTVSFTRLESPSNN